MRGGSTWARAAFAVPGVLLWWADRQPVVLAVWDSGVDIAIFKGQQFTNAKEQLNGRDDDGNGSQSPPSPPPAGADDIRSSRPAAGGGGSGSPCAGAAWLSSPSAAAWAADEVDNSGVYRALYSAECRGGGGGGGSDGLGEGRAGRRTSFAASLPPSSSDGSGTPLLVLTKDRTDASYYSLGHTTNPAAAGASGESPLFMGQTAEYALRAHDGVIVSATIAAGAGLRQGADWAPPPGHPASVYDTPADAPPMRTPFSRAVVVDVSSVGAASVSSAVLASGASAEREAHARVLEALEDVSEAGHGTVVDIPAPFTGLDVAGEPFSFHGLPALVAARRELTGDEKQRAGRSLLGRSSTLLTVDSLLVDLTRTFRATIRENANAAASEGGLAGGDVLLRAGVDLAHPLRGGLVAVAERGHGLVGVFGDGGLDHLLGVDDEGAEIVEQVGV